MCSSSNLAVRPFGSPYLLSESSLFFHLPLSGVHLPFVSFLPTLWLHFFLSTVPMWHAGYFWLLYSPHLICYTHSTSLSNPIPSHSLTSISLHFDLLYDDVSTLALALFFTKQYSFMRLKLRPMSSATACCPQQCSSPFPVHTHCFPPHPLLWAFHWLLHHWSTSSSLCCPLIQLLTPHIAMTTPLILAISLTAFASIFWFICIFQWCLSSGHETILIYLPRLFIFCFSWTLLFISPPLTIQVLY